MNFKHILLAGAAVMTLAACSNDDVIGNGEDNNTGSGATFEGDGYMAVSINLPTTTATGRANDDFDHGDPAEYNVANAILILFGGDSNEFAAKFAEAHELTNPIDASGSEGDNITTSYKYVVELNSGNFQGSNIFGLVMLNYTDFLTFDAEGKLATIGGTAITSETSFAEVAAITNGNYENLCKANKFFMTNAPMSSTKGTVIAPEANGYVQTLVPINVKSIYASENEAAAGKDSAATFFVERAVAKVTLVDEINKVLADAEGKSTLKVAKIEWTLDNTETNSYLVRNVKAAAANYPWLGWANPNVGDDKWRFAGYKWMGTTSLYDAATPYRTYWCYDPAYSTPKDVTGLMTEFKAADEVFYCHENTFDVAHQTTANTTRAYLKVTFEVAEGDNLFTLNGNKKVAYNNEALAKHYASVLANTGEVKAAFKAALKASETPNETVIGADIQNYIIPEVSAITDDDVVTLVGFTFNTAALDATVFDAAKLTIGDTEKAEAIKYVNRVNKFTAFTGGVSYYPVLIKHFGDDLTPWNVEGNVDDVETAYGVTAAYAADGNNDANLKYLGRYGMVRNNWYVLTLNNINQLGTPSYNRADVEDKSDDNNHTEEWINFTVNVNSWAKRVQGVDLK